MKQGEFQVRVFDILAPQDPENPYKINWLPFEQVKELTSKFGVPMVHVIHENLPFNFDEIVKLAETYVFEGCPINEGIVVGPMKEKYDSAVGRVKLKVINPAYLEMS